MMRLARFYGVVVAISGLALGAMGRADAASVTYTTAINTLTQPGFIPQFNPDLGTLLEVDFSATGSAFAIIQVDPPVTSGTYRLAMSFLLIPHQGSLIGLGGFQSNSTFSFTTPTREVVLSSNFDSSNSITSGLASFYGNEVYNLQVTGGLLGGSPLFFIISPPVQQFSGGHSQGAGGTATVRVRVAQQL
jgi:hypothetical protein